MKKLYIKSLCLFTAFLLLLPSVCAITPRQMMENGEVSDGSVIYGDRRDGVVSDVSEEMGEVKEEMKELVSSVMPSESEPKSTNEAQATSQSEQVETNSDNADTSFGIIIAVLVVAAVVIAIFLFIKRK